MGLISSHFETLTADKTSKAVPKFVEKMQGNSDDCPDGDVEQIQPEVTKVHLNTGISIVIPAYQIRDFVLKIHRETGGWMPQNSNFWELK